MRLFARRLLLALGMPFLLSACANIGAPEPPSLELPKAPSDLRAIRKGAKVTLTWTAPTFTTDRQTLRSFGATRICRGPQPALTGCGKPIGESQPQNLAIKSPAQKATGSYVDVLLEAMQTDDPAKLATYAVEVLNANGRGAGLSNQVHVSLAHTLPPPANFGAQVTAKGVGLSWTGESAQPASPAIHYLYRVYRQQKGSKQQVIVGEIPARSEDTFTLTDASTEWQKTYEYHANAVTVIDAGDKSALQVEGDNTPTIEVSTNDVFPPAVPSGLQAVFSGPGQKPFIDLIWAPVTDLDLDGYNVYRREENGAPVKINTELLKVPAYRDTNVTSGRRYLYSVSAVDVRGNESARSDEAAERVP